MDKQLRDLARRAKDGDLEDKDRYIAALERALYGRLGQYTYTWHLDIMGEYGAHWGRGDTPEEALISAYRVYVQRWSSGPFIPPEEFCWRYFTGEMPQAVGPYVSGYPAVRPPKIDYDALLLKLEDLNMGEAIKITTAIFWIDDLDYTHEAANLIGVAEELEGSFVEWRMRWPHVEGDAPQGPVFCSHQNSESEGPNVSHCRKCNVIFRTDLP